MNKLVLAWVDNSGVELTGRYRDRLCQYAETRAVPEAKSCVWGNDTPAMRTRLDQHIATMAGDHAWTGFYSLANTDALLATARKMALTDAAKNNSHKSH